MIVGLIPARLKSTRLREKPLIKIDGIEMIIHVLKRAQLSKKLDKVIVCTDSQKILNVVKKNEGEAILTSNKHINGTERINEVAKKINGKIFVDLQCDEVFLNPKNLDKLINFHLKNYFYDIVVPHSEFNSCNNKNIVKISSNNHGKILYMSRADIPYNYNNNRKILKKHLDFISFKKKALHDYCKYKITHNESVESVELLRAIENNLELGTIKINSDVFSINTKKDLILAKKIMKKCKIRKKY